MTTQAVNECFERIVDDTEADVPMKVKNLIASPRCRKREENEEILWNKKDSVQLHRIEPNDEEKSTTEKFVPRRRRV